MGRGKTAGRVLGLLLALCLLSGCGGDAPESLLPAPPEPGQALDVAGVLGEETRARIREGNAALQAAGAQVSVAALDVLGERTAAQYAAGLFDSWGLGRRDVLILLSVGEGEYYLLQGSEVGQDLTDQLLGDLAWRYLERDFAAGAYDAGVRKLFDALCQWYQERYDLAVPDGQETGEAQTSDDPSDPPAAPARSDSGRPVWPVAVAIAAVAVAAVLVVLRLRKRRDRYGSSSRRGRRTGGYRGGRRSR